MSLNKIEDHLILSDSLIRDALIMLEKLGEDSTLFAINPEGILIGALTDGDVRRGLLRGCSIEDPIDLILEPGVRYICRGETSIENIVEYRDKLLLKIVPLVDKDKRVIKIVNFRNSKSFLPVDAVIMAGGRGQRLSPLTDFIPKPLLKVGNKPIIEHNLDRLVSFGVDNFWISVNYLGDLIKDYFGAGVNKSIELNYVQENKPLGTIGAISQIKNFKHDYVLITNSDILTNLDYELYFLDFIQNDADVAVVTIPYKMTIPYAVLEISNRMILSFKEKPTYTYYSNAGIYLIKKDCLEKIPDESFFNATDLIEILIKDGKKVISYPFNGYWLDIGNPEDFKRAQVDIQTLTF